MKKKKGGGRCTSSPTCTPAACPQDFFSLSCRAHAHPGTSARASESGCGCDLPFRGEAPGRLERHAVSADAHCLTLSISNGNSLLRTFFRAGRDATTERAGSGARKSSQQHKRGERIGTERPPPSMAPGAHTAEAHLVASEVRRGRKEGHHRFPSNALPTVTTPPSDGTCVARAAACV